MNAIASDIEIARSARLQPITELAGRLDIPATQLHNFGHHIAKLDLEYVNGLADRPDGKLILVTAITPTPAGEGKTTTTIGLTDALNRIGRHAMTCIRSHHWGPVLA